MMKFLTKRRYNYIDTLGLATSMGFFMKGLWLEWIITVVVTIVVSLYLESKTDE